MLPKVGKITLKSLCHFNDLGVWGFVGAAADHKHKLLTHKCFLLPFVPGNVPGKNWVCPRDKLGFFHCVNKEKTWLFPWDKVGLSQGQTQLVPGTFPGSSQEQPNQKIYVYVPFSCLKGFANHEVHIVNWNIGAWSPKVPNSRFALHGLGVRKRSFKEGVSGGMCLVFPGTFLPAFTTEKEHPKELQHKMPFPKRLSWTL